MYALASKIHIREETIFWSLVGLIFSLAILYGYFVNTTIFNVADRVRLESNIAQLNSSLGELEFEYLSLKGAVTLESAYALGFINAEAPIFISRDTNSKGLSYSNR